jgi:nitrate reductase gamma subunit
VRIAVLVSLGWCAVALVMPLLLVLTFGARHARAPQRAPAWRGVVHAFGPGMLPWKKDGARRHPGVVVAGGLYHVAVATALALLAVRLSGLALPRPAAAVAAATLAAGTCAGIALLVRRLRSAMLRRISAPDDYASNVVVDLFLASAAMSVAKPELLGTFFLVATVLLVYAPFGKIRHCLYFPVARVMFGARVGRRGVVPGASQGGRA